MQGLRKNAYNYPLYKNVHEVTSFSKKPIFQLGNFEKAFINEIVIDTVLYEQKPNISKIINFKVQKFFLKVSIPTFALQTMLQKLWGDNALYELQLN